MEVTVKPEKYTITLFLCHRNTHGLGCVGAREKPGADKVIAFWHRPQTGVSFVTAGLSAVTVKSGLSHAVKCPA